MFKKLDKMLDRFERLNEMVSDPNVIAKMDEWTAYSKELSDITETVEKYTEYKKTKKEIEDLEKSIAQEKDAEMKSFMEDELQDCK